MDREGDNKTRAAVRVHPILVRVHPVLVRVHLSPGTRTPYPGARIPVRIRYNRLLTK